MVKEIVIVSLIILLVYIYYSNQQANSNVAPDKSLSDSEIKKTKRRSPALSNSL